MLLVLAQSSRKMCFNQITQKACAFPINNHRGNMTGQTGQRSTLWWHYVHLFFMVIMKMSWSERRLLLLLPLLCTEVWEEEADLSLGRFNRIWAVRGVSCVRESKLSPDGGRRGVFGSEHFGRPHKFPPVTDGVLSGENIRPHRTAWHEFNKSLVEESAWMFSIKPLRVLSPPQQILASDNHKIGVQDSLVNGLQHERVSCCIRFDDRQGELQRFGQASTCQQHYLQRTKNTVTPKSWRWQRKFTIYR